MCNTTFPYFSKSNNSRGSPDTERFRAWFVHGVLCSFCPSLFHCLLSFAALLWNSRITWFSFPNDGNFILDFRFLFNFILKIEGDSNDYHLSLCSIPWRLVWAILYDIDPWWTFHKAVFKSISVKTELDFLILLLRHILPSHILPNNHLLFS